MKKSSPSRPSPKKKSSRGKSSPKAPRSHDNDLQELLQQEKSGNAILKDFINRFLFIESHCDLIGRSREPAEIVNALTSLAHRILPFQTAAVYLFRPEENQFTLFHGEQLDSRHRALIQSHFDQGVIQWVISEKRAIVIPDLTEVSATQPDPHSGFVMVPMLSAMQPVGFLEIWTDEVQNIRARNQLALLDLVARQAAVALENSALYQKLTSANEQLKRSQEQAVHAEKMAAVGLLASGVAHEINNPLQIILARVQFQNRKSHGQEVDATLKLVEKESLRISNIVGTILRYAQNQNKSEMQPTRMDAIIHDTLILTNALLTGQSIQIECEFHDDFPELVVHPGEIEQVLLNLIENARYAMKQGGTLRIKTGTHDNQVFIEVEDTGCGIPREYLGRIFDPFFTTKPPQEGTGLGLFLSYGIMKRHQGDIQVESTPGKGTRFRLIFPLPPAVPPS